jgi:hypothetical protein
MAASPGCCHCCCWKSGDGKPQGFCSRHWWWLEQHSWSLMVLHLYKFSNHGTAAGEVTCWLCYINVLLVIVVASQNSHDSLLMLEHHLEEEGGRRRRRCLSWMCVCEHQPCTMECCCSRGDAIDVAQLRQSNELQTILTASYWPAAETDEKANAGSRAAPLFLYECYQTKHI